jgi:hypothetical protein
MDLLTIAKKIAYCVEAESFKQKYPSRLCHRHPRQHRSQPPHVQSARVLPRVKNSHVRARPHAHPTPGTLGACPLLSRCGLGFLYRLCRLLSWRSAWPRCMAEARATQWGGARQQVRPGGGWGLTRAGPWRPGLASWPRAQPMPATRRSARASAPMEVPEDIVERSAPYAWRCLR